MLQVTKQNTDWKVVIDRARQLDPDAFDMLVDEYAPRVRGFLRKIVRNGDVDDLVQELFLRVVRAIGRYQDVGRFEAWIFQIARNLAHDYVRDTVRQSIVVSVEGGGDPDRMMQRKASGAAVGETLERAESAGKIEEAIQRLPDAEREVILLRHYGQLSFEEIARMMDTPLGTALARSHRGLAKLREWMEATE